MVKTRGQKRKLAELEARTTQDDAPVQDSESSNLPVQDASNLPVQDTSELQIQDASDLQVQDASNLQIQDVSSSSIQNMIRTLDRMRTLVEGMDERTAQLPEFKNFIDPLRELELGLKEMIRKKPRLTFSAVSSKELKNVGATKKLLYFREEKIAQLVASLPANAEVEIVGLRNWLRKIYRHVNRNYEPAARTIIDAVLVALAEITSNTPSDSPNSIRIAILPETKIAPGDGVQVINPISGYRLWLSGTVDYGIAEVDGEDADNNAKRLLSHAGSAEDIQQMSSSLTLLEAKRQDHQSLHLSIPEAVSQAIALKKSLNLSEVRFCLSNGHSWLFFVLMETKDGELTYYESDSREISKEELQNMGSDMLSLAQLREIVALLREWIKPTMKDLYKMKE